LSNGGLSLPPIAAAASEAMRAASVSAAKEAGAGSIDKFTSNAGEVLADAVVVGLRSQQNGTPESVGKSIASLALIQNDTDTIREALDRVKAELPAEFRGLLDYAPTDPNKKDVLSELTVTLGGVTIPMTVVLACAQQGSMKPLEDFLRKRIEVSSLKVDPKKDAKAKIELAIKPIKFLLDECVAQNEGVAPTATCKIENGRPKNENGRANEPAVRLVTRLNNWVLGQQDALYRMAKSSLKE